ncbi:MAG: pilus assembly protein PilM [Weeksellaceae bacterium]
MANSLFAVDINEKYTRIAHLNVLKNKQVELLSLGVDDTTPNFFLNLTTAIAQQQAKVIMKLTEQLHLKNDQISVVIPDSFTYSQVLIMPNLKEQELVQSIRLQADEFVPLPIDEVYIDLEVITKLPNDMLLILIVAAQKKIVDHIAMTMELAKLQSVSLENELSAVGRFVSEVFKISTEPSLIINFGFRSSSLYVVNPALPHFQVTRSTRIGLELLIRDLKVNLNWEDAQTYEALKTIGLSESGSVNINAVVYPIMNELLSEIQKTILQVKDKLNLPIRNIYLFNYNNHVAHLTETIQAKTGLPTFDFPIATILKPNPITKSFQNNLSPFVGVIATHIR